MKQLCLPLWKPTLLLEDPAINYRRKLDDCKRQALKAQKAKALARKVYLRYEKVEISIKIEYEKLDERLCYFDGRFKRLKPSVEYEAPMPKPKPEAKKPKLKKLFEFLTPEQKAELLLFLEQ